MVIGLRVFSNVGFGDDVRIWEGSIKNETLYLMFEAKAIVGFMAGLLVIVAIFIEVPRGRYEISHGCRV